MFAFRSTLKLSSLLALAVLAACGVSAGGAIPCADDSSCPTDYPVCDASAGKCIAGTPAPASAATVQIVSVTRDDGASSSAAITGTATVTVLARANAGVVKDSVKVTAGSKLLAPIAATPPTFTFKLDTADLFAAPGVDQTPVTLKATMRTGDQPTVDVASVDKVIQVDDKAPTLSAPQLVATHLKPGAALEMDITASETLASITGTVSAAGVVDGALTEVSVQGKVHRISAPVLASAQGGVYAVTLQARDLAGNVSTLSSAASFTIHTPISLATSNLIISTARNVNLGGVLAATAGDVIQIAITLPAGLVLAPGALPSVSVGPAGTAGTPVAVSAVGPGFVASYGISNQTDGSYVVSLGATDIAGSVSTPVTSAFLVSKTAPAIAGGVTLAATIAGPNRPVRFGFLRQVGETAAATVAGHAAACSGTTVVTCSYLPTAADVPPGTVVGGVPVIATVTDALGNTSAAQALVTLDSQPPTFNASAALNLVDVLPGNLLTLDVLPSEPISGLSASVSSGGSIVGAMSEIAPASADGTRHLGYPVPANLTNGAVYNVEVSAFDLAANAAVALDRAFTFHSPFTLAPGSLTLHTAAGVLLNGTLAATTGNVVNASLTLPASITLAPGAQPSFSMGAAGGVQTPLPAAGSNPFTASYTVVGTETDGSYQITAAVTDIAGNQASITRPFLISKTAPTIPGGITLTSTVAGPNLPVRFTFVAPSGTTGSATVNGQTASCSGTSVISCAYTPAAVDVAPGTVASGIAVRATVKDVLGNTGIASTTVTLDAQPPTFTTAGLSAPDVLAGVLLTLNAKPSESITDLTAVITGGGSTVGAMTEIAPPDADGTRHLGYAVPATLTNDTVYTVTLAASDLAANPSVPLTFAFTFHGSFTLASSSLTLSTAAGVTINGMPAATALTAVNVSLTVPATILMAAGAKPSIGVGAPGAAPTPLTVSGTGPYTASYTVPGTLADGTYVITATVTDIAGNSASVTKTFVVDKSPPFITGLTLSPANVHASAPINVVTLTGTATKRLKTATVSTTSGDSGTCLCDGVACTGTGSATPVVTCTVTVSHGPSAATALVTTATVSLTDPLGNASAGGSLYQAAYNVWPLPVATSLAPTPASGIITSGTTASLTPVFSGGTGTVGASAGISPGPVATGVPVNVTPTVATTYTLTVTSPAGDAVQTGTSITPVSAPAGSLTLGKQTIKLGQSTSLVVAFSGGNAVLSENPVDNSVPTAPTNNQIITVAPSQTTIYTLTVTNTAGTVFTTSATLTVGQNVAVSLSGPVSPIIPGQVATLTATASTNVIAAGIDPAPCSPNCTITPDGSPHTVTVTPSTSTTYTLTGTNSAGSTGVATATVVVTSPTISGFTGPTSWTSAKSGLTLVAGFNAAAGAVASIPNCSSPAPSVSPATFTCSPILSDTTFNLTVTLGTGPNSTATAAVKVLVASDPTNTNLSGPSSSIDPGSAVVFTGNGCAGCSVTFSPALSIDTGATTGAFTAHAATPPTQTTVYSMSVTNAAGDTATKSAVVTVNQPSIASFTGPAYVTTGTAPSLTVQFSPANAVATVNGGCTGGAVTGTGPYLQTFSGCAALTANTTYTLTLALGPDSQQATTSVQVAPDPATATLSFPGSAVNPGSQANFSGVGCAGCAVTFNPALVIDTGAVTGAFTAHLATNPTADTLVTMSVTNQAGKQVTKTATATTVQPVIVGFTGPTYVTTGTAPSFTVQFTPATATTTITGGCTGGTVSGTSPATQSFTGCAAINANTPYTVSLQLGTKSVTATASVQVAPDSANATLTSTGGAINPGAVATFSGVGCTSCTVTFNPPLTLDTGTTDSSFTGHLTTNPTFSTLVTMSVTNQAGKQVTKSATATVNQPVIASFTGPAYVSSGSAPTLTAQYSPSSAVATVTASTGGGCTGGTASGINPTSQTFSGCPGISGTTTYTLTVTLGANSVTASVLVLIASDVTNTSINATNSPLVPGAQANFSGSGCAGCTISFSQPVVIDTGVVTAAFTGHLAANPNASTTVTMAVTNQAGTQANKTASFIVTQPQIVGFTGPGYVTTGGTATLTVQYTPATATATVGGCSAGAVTGTAPAVQTFSCAGLSADASFTAQLVLGSVTVNETVQVLVAPDPNANLTFAATPTVLPFGGTTNQVTVRGTFCGGSTRCTASFTANGGTPTSVTSGTGSTVTQTATTTYTLLVVNAAGASASSQLTVSSYYGTVPTPIMNGAREGAAVALLPSGKVLVAGGSTAADRSGAVNTAEIFDPSTGNWSLPTGATATLSVARFQATATLLQNGTVLIAGGANNSSAALSSVDIYDPVTDQFLAQQSGTSHSLQINRANQVAVGYAGGSNVFFAGGGDNTCEIFTQGSASTNGTFAACTSGQMQAARAGASAAVLQGRYVVISGGAGTDTSADVYDLNSAGTNGFTALPAGTMRAARTQASATVLSNGKVLIAGGADGTGTALSSAELFTLSTSSGTTGTSTAIASTLSIARTGHSAVKLNGGGVLFFGGTNGASCGGTPSNCNVDAYDPVLGLFGRTFSVSTARALTFAVPLLLGNRVLVGGGTIAPSMAELVIP